VTTSDGVPGIVEAELDMVVDTGATYSAVPEAVARELGLRRNREVTVRLADGTRQVRPLVEVRVLFDGRETPTLAFTMPDDAPPLLGAHALEGLGLGVDPVEKRLVPVENFLLAAQDGQYLDRRFADFQDRLDAFFVRQAARIEAGRRNTAALRARIEAQTERIARQAARLERLGERLDRLDRGGRA
jgi:clan AA aspartic protease